MKYALKSKSSPKLKAIYRSDTTKASYTLFMEFLNSKKIGNDYFDNLIHIGNIKHYDEAEEYIIDIIYDTGPRSVIDHSLDWGECIFPKNLVNKSKYWSNLNPEFIRRTCE